MSARPKVERRVVRWLTHTRLPLAVALLAVALALPSLEGGWLWDDIFHHAVLLGRTDFSPWEMFSFANGGPDPVRSSIDSGVAPWWTSQNFRFTLLRFLTVATHRLDHALWPNSPALMHAHSLVWFGLLVAAAASLYRRVLGAGWVAGLAALAYSVDEVHVWPAAWIANRHSLLATFFGLLCLIAHDRYRRDSWRQGAWLAPLSLALALAAGESATATLGYLAGHAFFLDRAPRRLAALAPYGMIVALWASVYRVFGFGIAGSGIYIDPGAEPARFAAALIRRAPFSVLGQLTAIPADVGGVLAPGFPPGLWMFALAAVVVLLLLILPLLRGDRVARFFAAGMLLSTVPISGTLPASRHLVFVGFGAMGLVAQLVQGAFAGAPWMPVSRAWRYTIRAYAALLLLWHPALSWTSFPIQISSMKALAEPTTTALESLPTDAALVHQDLIVVNTPDYFFFVSLAPALDKLTSRPAPRHIRALANGPSPVAITRRDAQSLEVRLERGLFMSTLARFFRDDADLLVPGQIISLTGLTITIEETAEDGSPTRILYRFDRPLEDSTLRWVYWLYGVYLPFTLPGIGMTVHLEPAVGPIEQLAESGLADETAQRSRWAAAHVWRRAYGSHTLRSSRLGGSHMAQLVYSEDELLSSVAYDEPLVANGVRCHGGFVGGRYQSPRSALRNPAITAWQAQLRAQGTPLIDIPVALVPPHYPSAAQAVLLLREGVRDPLVRTLTTIAIIEGFGAMIRDQPVPDLDACVREPLDGTATAHLRAGLFEAHARDEAGHRHEGGHKQMWEAARDLALSNPSIPGDVLMRLMTGGRSAQRQRLFQQLDPRFEELLTTMANVMIIEIFAADTFAWAEEVLGNAEVSARPREAAAMVGYIRADETPHVEYLRTALSELRACTLLGVDGSHIEGHLVVDGLLNRGLRVLTGDRPKRQRVDTRADVAAAVATHADGAGLQRRFDALEVAWTPPSGDGFVRLVA